MVTRPIEPGSLSLVNQTAPSGPATIPFGLAISGPVKLETTPAVVIRPIVSFPVLVNQSAPSGPTVMPPGPEMPVPV